MIKTCAACVTLEKRVKALEEAVASLAHLPATNGMEVFGPGPYNDIAEVPELPPLTEDEIESIQRALDGHNLPTDVLHPFLHPSRGMK